MVPYNNSQYGTHYDPVGSQYNQQQSYNYSYGAQRPAATSHNQEPATTSAYQTPTYPTSYPNNSYYGNNTSWSTANAQPQSTTENRAAETLSSLSAQEHGQNPPSNTRDTNAQYGASSWSTYNNADSNASTTHQRTTSNTSPLYPSNRPNTSVSSYASTQSYSQPATSASTYAYANMSQTPTVDQSRASTTRTPTTGYTHPVPPVQTSSVGQQSYRPHSPYATQQKSNADKATSSTTRRLSNSNPTTMLANNRDQYQQSSRPANTGQPRAPSVTPSSVHQQASSQYARQSVPAEPIPTITVDPSQVYDPWPEQQRKYKQMEEKRRVEAAVRAEREEKERKAQETKKRIEDEKKKAEDDRRKAEEEETARQRHAEASRIIEGNTRRKQAHQDMLAREAARRNNPPTRPAPSIPPPAQTPQPPSNAAPRGADELEAEMLQMFQKMQEYNAKNPSLLARLWEQERQTHIAKTQSPTPAAAPLPASAAATPFQTSQTPIPAAPMAPATMARKPRSQANPASSKSVSTSASAPKPPPPQAGPASAIWPPGKKTHLADAAAKWLNAKPENANKYVSFEDVVDLLNGNPSYLTLCETLEKKGLAVDRAAFARALLTSVPDINKTNACQANSVSQPMVITHSADPARTSGATLDTPPTKSGKKKSPNVGKFPGQRGRPRKDGTGAHQTGNFSTASRSQSAAQASIQRTAVDLTDDEPGAARSKSLAQMYKDALRDQPSQHDTVAYQSDFSYAPPPDDGVDYSLPDAIATTQPQQGLHLAGASLSAQPVRKYQSPYFATGTGQNSQLIKQQPPPRPPASKEEAARKRTFADLIDLTAEQDSDEDGPPAKYPNTQQHTNTGVHVSEQQWASTNFQQYAYDGSRQNNFAVGFVSVPDGPPAQPNQPASVPITSLATELKDKILVQPIRREKVARKSKYDPRTICRDVLLATGRHPTMHGLNQHLFDMQELLKAHSVNVEMDKYDLATIDWNQLDPGEPIPEAAAADQDDADADDEGDGKEVSAAAAVDEPTFKMGKNGQLFKPFGKKKGKVGRPPRSSYRPAGHAGQSASGGETSAGATPNTSTSKPVTNAPSDVINTPKLNVKQRAESSMTPGSGAVGYAAFNATNVTYDESGKPVKRKGRPVGWRKSIHSKAALTEHTGGTPPAATTSSAARRQGQNAPSYDQVPRRRGRPIIKHLHGTKVPEPEFNVYKCEWDDCKAELHNIDTLRKHLIKIHGKKTSDGDYECSWRGCFKPSTDNGKQAADDFDSSDEINTYQTMEPWMEHIEAEHIMPLARTLGDGPRAGLSGPHDSEASEAYLSDASGRIVTPKIVIPETREVGTPEYLTAQRRVLDAKRLSELQGQRLEGEKLLQQLEGKKRVVGPGLDRGGCTLANAERRKGLYDDEDFEDIIEPDEPDELE